MINILVYSLTSDSSHLEYAAKKLEAIKVKLLDNKQLNVCLKVLFDNGTQVKDTSNGQQTKSPGLNACINYLIENFADEFDYFIRIDDTDTVIFPFGSTTNIGDVLRCGVETIDIVTITKAKISDTLCYCDNLDHVESWQTKRSELSASNIDRQSLDEIQRITPNGAGCFVNTAHLQKIYPFPAHTVFGDDVWLFNAQRDIQIKIITSPIYIYEKIGGPYVNNAKTNSRIAVLKEALNATS